MQQHDARQAEVTVDAPSARTHRLLDRFGDLDAAHTLPDAETAAPAWGGASNWGRLNEIRRLSTTSFWETAADALGVQDMDSSIFSELTPLRQEGPSEDSSVQASSGHAKRTMTDMRTVASIAMPAAGPRSS
eukprot:4222192-Prymnesium_polylepis.1